MKLVVSDYDGTFFQSEEKLLENIKSVKEFRKKENMFVIATGRSYYDLTKLNKEYEIEYDYAIINSGTTIIKNNEVLYNQIIEDDLVLKIKELMQLDKALFTFTCSALESRCTFDDKNLTKLHAVYSNEEEALTIKKEIEATFSKEVNCYLVCNDTAIEVISSKTSKAVAIEELIEIINIAEKDVYVIGDASNDIEMIKRFDGCCVINAIEEIKKESTKVYKTVGDLINDIY